MNTAALAENPLLTGATKHRFDLIQAEHVGPAVDVLIYRCEAALTQAVEPDFPADFDKASAVLDVPLQDLEVAWGAVHHLLSVCNTPELRAAVMENEPKVTEFNSRIASDLRLYELYKSIHREQGDRLTPPQLRSLEIGLRGFQLSGAELDDASKARFAETLQRSAVLSHDFSQHVLDATDEFVLYVSAEELDGVPKELLAAMAEQAKADGHEGKFKVTLQLPCLAPLLQYATNRKLRETLYHANATRASEFGPAERDNGPVIAELLKLRHERAKLLSQPHHAAVSLIPKMADSAEQVLQFLGDLAQRSRASAEVQLAELREFARERLGMDTIKAWDLGYVGERLRQERYDFSEEEVRQYFQLEPVLAGLFGIAENLFDVSISATRLPGWHPTVRSFMVERDGQLLGHFYLDPFARAGKQGGAWMNGIVPRWRQPDGTLRTAVAYLVTNFAAPVDGQDALLRHGDVLTLFHEFGHGLHFLLSQVETLGVSGLSGVEWDAVELPSQLMENFAWQWETLSPLSAHVKTGNRMPRDLFDKMRSARNFMNGLSMVRQIEMSTFDMRIHVDPEAAEAVQTITEQVRAETALIEVPTYNRYPNSFSHIFAGAYSAGYFSYLWADVLACDAWDVFAQASGYSTDIGRRYRETILEVGGSRPMSTSFEAFVGRQPSVDAMLRQRGLAPMPA